MSHTITIKTVFKNIDMLKLVCKKMGLRAEMVQNQTLYTSTGYTGLAIHLTKWKYPIVVESDGTVRYDSWGSQEGAKRELDILKRNYSLEFVRQELTQKRLPFTEKVLETGEIELYVNA